MKVFHAVMTVVLLALAAPVFALPSADKRESRTISVSAEGVAVVRPDIALVRLGVETLSPSVKDAFAENRDLINAVRAAVRAAGIAEKDEATINFSVRFEQAYDPDPAAPQKQGSYRVTNGLALTVREMGKLGELIDAAVEAGANQLWGVEFGVENRVAAEASAREAAVKAAIAKASTLAAAAGVALGVLESLVDAGTSSPGPLESMQLKTMARGADSSSAVSPGEAELRVGVQAVFSIR